MTPSLIEIRTATASDVPHILALVRALAVFEREPDAVKATEADLLRDGFGPHPKFEVRLAWTGVRAVGFALFYTNYSTWEGRPGLFIEDLFVDESVRGTGLGRRLVADVARIAVERGYSRLALNVLDWNPARGFYEAIGLEHMSEWLPYRISGAALREFAAS